MCHLPDESTTLQIGESAIIAARTGADVVADFRPRDLAEGGQGASLVPYVDWALLRDQHRNRVALNVGGIANATILPANCELEAVRAWDTGPGNMVIDACARALFSRDYDANGELAARGNRRRGFTATCSDFIRFSRKIRPNPRAAKSLAAPSRRGFHTLNRDPHDILAEVTWITAHSVANSLREHSGFGEDFDLIVSGGGAYNATLLQMLREELPGARVLVSDEVGIRADAKEALAFAILAHETLNGVATGVASVTGARKSAILGKLVRA